MLSRSATTVLVLTIALTAWTPAGARDVRPHAGMLRFPDVGKTHIVFVYANVLWLVPREGAMATLPGVEPFPRFSPDKTFRRPPPGFIGKRRGRIT